MFSIDSFFFYNFYYKPDEAISTISIVYSIDIVLNFL